jgi:hypothetical protein
LVFIHWNDYASQSKALLQLPDAVFSPLRNTIGKPHPFQAEESLPAMIHGQLQGRGFNAGYGDVSGTRDSFRGYLDWAANGLGAILAV